MIIIWYSECLPYNEGIRELIISEYNVKNPFWFWLQCSTKSKRIFGFYEYD